MTDAAGNVITDTFDTLDRNTARSVSLATGFSGTTSETRTYDALGRMLTNADNDYKVTLTYGVIGLSSQVYSEQQEYVSGGAYARTVTRTWDANGNKATETYPSGLALAYAYTPIDLLASISDGTYTIASYTYMGSRPLGVTFQNGTTQANSYGGFRGEVTSILHETSGSSTIVQLDYGYNQVHDRMYERFGSSGSSGDGFAYDRLRRLTNAWMGSSTPSSPSAAAYVTKIDYNMDDDGNRTSVVVTPYGSGSSSTSYSTNSLNQYSSVGGTSHTYDDNGNLRDDGTRLYDYDYRNQLVRVRLKSSGAVLGLYRFDALGRRVEKTTNGGSTVERYIYSGLETVATYDGSNNWQQDFVYSTRIDGIVMLEQADVLDFDTDSNTSEITRSFYHTNALGSVMEITDMNESVAVSYRYDPYGSVTITVGGTPQSSDPLGQHWTFTGRFFDEECHEYYLRSRGYSASLGRFLQRDPVGLGAGPTLYEYVFSCPVALSDPLGTFPTPQGMSDYLTCMIECAGGALGLESPVCGPVVAACVKVPTWLTCTAASACLVLVAKQLHDCHEDCKDKLSHAHSAARPPPTPSFYDQMREQGVDPRFMGGVPAGDPWGWDWWRFWGR